jgi:hypothetical protein
MKIIKILLMGIIIIFLSGCGQKVISLTPTGYANQYEIVVEGDTGFTISQHIIMKAVNEAKKKCKNMGKHYHKISLEYLPAGFLFWPKATLIFECNNNLIPTRQKILILDNNKLEQKIKEINDLYKKGLISKKEYNKKRNELLDNF